MREMEYRRREMEDRKRETRGEEGREGRQKKRVGKEGKGERGRGKSKQMRLKEERKGSVVTAGLSTVCALPTWAFFSCRFLVSSFPAAQLSLAALTQSHNHSGQHSIFDTTLMT